MAINKRVKLTSSGKINLYLNVNKNLRPDGFHEIKSIMQSVGLSDELIFDVSQNHGAKTKNNKDNLNGNGISIRCNNVNVEIPLNEKNLVHKAAFLILERFDLKKKYNIKIHIKKQIPVSAGLAGGSSNAAATLIALNRIFNINLSYDELKSLGNDVGSDVPFCINGGTALVEGKGEIISKLPDMPFYWIVLAINGKKFSSGDVYDRFDLIGKGKKPSHEALTNKLKEKKYAEFFKGLDNDLENVVTSEDLMVNTLKNKALQLGAFSSQMTGSGPAIFAFCQDLIIARKVYDGLAKMTDKVFLSHTTPRGISFIN